VKRAVLRAPSWAAGTCFGGAMAPIKEIFDRCYRNRMQPIQGVSKQRRRMFKASGREGALGSEIASRAANPELCSQITLTFRGQMR
jgi:hypothetical protein